MGIDSTLKSFLKDQKLEPLSEYFEKNVMNWSLSLILNIFNEDKSGKELWETLQSLGLKKYHFVHLKDKLHFIFDIKIQFTIVNYIDLLFGINFVCKKIPKSCGQN